MIGNTEKHYAAYSRIRQFFQFAGKKVHRVPVLSFHGRDLVLSACSLLYEERIDQGGFVDPGLSHHLS